jgi:hypothetical protein
VLDNRLAIPVIAGLAVSLVIALGFAFDPSRVVDSDTSTGHTRDGSLRIWIGGMEDRYSVNEPIDFTFHVKGHSYFCQGPTAKIINSESGETVHDIPELDVHILCLPETKDIDMIIPLEEIMSPYSPILLEPGQYALIVEFQGVTLDKMFIVSDD